jgi:hypothetical protein
MSYDTSGRRSRIAIPRGARKPLSAAGPPNPGLLLKASVHSAVFFTSQSHSLETALSSHRYRLKIEKGGLKTRYLGSIAKCVLLPKISIWHSVKKRATLETNPAHIAFDSYHLSIKKISQEFVLYCLIFLFL